MTANYFESLVEDVEDEQMNYFDKWMTNGWFGLINNVNNNNEAAAAVAAAVAEEEEEDEKNGNGKLVSFDGKFNLIDNGKSIISIPYQLTIVNEENGNVNGNSNIDSFESFTSFGSSFIASGGSLNLSLNRRYCIKLTYLSTRGMFSNFFDKMTRSGADIEDEFANDVLPIHELALFARTWNDGCIDIIGCIDHISPHWGIEHEHSSGNYNIGDDGDYHNNGLLSQDNENNEESMSACLIIEKIYPFGDGLQHKSHHQQQQQQLGGGGMLQMQRHLSEPVSVKQHSSSSGSSSGKRKNNNNVIFDVLFNNDEIIVCINENGSNINYFVQIELSWFRYIPLYLSKGIEDYVDLLQNHDESIISSLKPIGNNVSNNSNNRGKTNGILSMFVLRSLQMMEDKLIFYDKFGNNYKKSLLATLLSSSSKTQIRTQKHTQTQRQLQLMNNTHDDE